MWVCLQKTSQIYHFSNQKEPTYFSATSRILGIQLHVMFVLVFSMLSLILFFYPRSADQGELGTKSRVFHSHEIKSFTMTLFENLVLMERVLLTMEYKLTQNKWSSNKRPWTHSTNISITMPCLFMPTKKRQARTWSSWNLIFSRDKQSESSQASVLQMDQDVTHSRT